MTLIIHLTLLTMSCFIGVTTGRGSVVRINANSHPAGYANDNIYVTSWISAIDEREVNMTMSLVQGSGSAYEVRD